LSLTVFMVRHASHDLLGARLAGRMAGVSLSEKGRAEAGRVAARLARETAGAVVTSPTARAVETAEAIGARLGLVPESVPALDEIAFGAWTGMSFEELDHDPGWRNWNAARAVARPPGGETMLEVQARAVGFVEGRRHETEGAIVLVSHADVIKVTVAYYLGLPVDSWHRFDIDPASVTTLVVGDWGARVVRLNEVPA
jgi:probable phosphoglycerate mutase